MKLNFRPTLLYSSESQGWQRLSEAEGCVIISKENKVRPEKPSWGWYITSNVATVAMLVTICFFLVLFALGMEQQDSNPQLLPKNSGTSKALQDKVITCYYNTPNRSANASRQLFPSQIHPHLCTHINIAFARVVDKQIYLEPSQYEALQEVINLKKVNSQLKVLLSVGGAGENNGFSEMVVDHASRKVFIKSIKSILRNYTLDGIDLDWEFPAIHLQHNYKAARERQHFSQLLREIRMEYIREKRDYLLTVAIAAPQTIVDVSYDVDQINLYVDFANIMTYDFHYYSKFTPFTGLNSPLYARANEELYLATLNINYTVWMYIAKGLDENKIVVGIPTYGHTFQLVNENNPNVGSPASGFGSVGGLGFVNYPDVCAFLGGMGVSQRWEEAALVPYLYSGREWISFESPRSVAAKADYIKARGLRGAMIYSLNADDYVGSCGARGADDTTFPLAQSVRRVLRPPGGGSR